MCFVRSLKETVRKYQMTAWSCEQPGNIIKALESCEYGRAEIKDKKC